MNSIQMLTALRALVVLTFDGKVRTLIDESAEPEIETAVAKAMEVGQPFAVLAGGSGEATSTDGRTILPWDGKIRAVLTLGKVPGMSTSTEPILAWKDANVAAIQGKPVDPANPHMESWAVERFMPLSDESPVAGWQLVIITTTEMA